MPRPGRPDSTAAGPDAPALATSQDFMTNSNSAAETKPKKTGAAETWETIKTVVYALAIAFVIRTLLFQPYTIPSASEEPNLYQGDYIIVTKWSYGYSRHSILFSPPLFKGRIFFHAPTRGDIVVFKLPRDGHTDYIKRLIGLPGDHVQMRGGRLYINEKLIPEAQRPRRDRHRPRLPRTGRHRSRDQSRGPPVPDPGSRAERSRRQHRRLCRAAALLLHAGRQPRQLRRQPVRSGPRPGGSQARRLRLGQPAGRRSSVSRPASASCRRRTSSAARG